MNDICSESALGPVHHHQSLRQVLGPGPAKQFEDDIQHHLKPIYAFIHSPPVGRAPHALATHYEDLIRVFDDVSSWERYLPPIIFLRIRNDIRHLQDMLEALKEDRDQRVNTIVAQEWLNIPGGGRELNLDLQLLSDLAGKGLADWEIAVYLHCSHSTVWRVRKKHNIPKRDWSAMT